MLSVGYTPKKKKKKKSSNMHLLYGVYFFFRHRPSINYIHVDVLDAGFKVTATDIVLIDKSINVQYSCKNKGMVLKGANANTQV